MHTIARERVNFVQLTPAMRRSLEGALECLIALFDALDGDADLEPEPDDDDGDEREPTLGAPEQNEDVRLAWARGSRDDGDAEITACEFSDSSRGFGVIWNRGYRIPDDAETSHDTEDDETGREPFLGAPEWDPAAGDADWARGQGGSDDDIEDSVQVIHMAGGGGRA